MARDRARPAEVRVDALSARPAGSALDPDLFDLLRTSLEPARPAALRTAAAAVLQKARLDRSQLLALARSLDTAGPLELARLIPAFENSGDEEVGLAMIAGLDRSKARSTVRGEILRPTLAKYPEPVQRAGEALLASINVDAAKQATHLDELLKAVQSGDVARGQAVFNSPKAACLSCHAIGYIGGRVGPDLTRVGQVRSERDLLEAVVFPNASFARGFEPVVVRTRTGQLHGGVVRSDTPAEIVLAAVSGPRHAHRSNGHRRNRARQRVPDAARLRGPAHAAGAGGSPRVSSRGAVEAQGSRLTAQAKPSTTYSKILP